MSFFTKKNFLYKLIACVCIFLALINFANPQRAYAADKEDTGIGGVLLTPICNLLLALGDAIMDIMQKSIMGANNATIRIDVTEGVNWGAIILGILAGIAYVALWIIPGTQGIAASITGFMVKAALAYGALNLVTAGGVHATVSAISAEVIKDVAVLPTFAIGPEEIFSGRILLFDANIFNPKEVKVDYNITDLNSDAITGTGTATLEQWKNLKTNPQNKATKYYYTDNNGEPVITSINNSAYELRNVISKWYYIIRNIALVGASIVLLYIGIRMMMTSIAADKAKYKQMLSDWVIALCLMVLMHYMMIFAHNIVESITNIFNNMTSPGEDIAVIVDPGDKLEDAVEKLENANGVQYIFEEDGVKSIKWPTNMMGRFRVEAQNKNGTEQYIGYALAYLTLVVFTLVFSFTYIKRLLYLLFLTVIAPFVALTYPIDKIHDGKAQAFDMWMKEYIFNLLIQPFHLLLYTIFVTMAFDLASTNVIYSLVVLGFMIPAEKFLRTMFGFNKASTPGLFAGAAGAALTMSAVNTLGKFAKGGHGGSGGNGSGGKGQGKDEQGKLRTANSDYEHSQEGLFRGLTQGNTDPEPNPSPNPGPNPDPDPNPDPNPDPDPNPGPNPGPNPDPNPDPNPGPNPGPNPDPNPDPNPGPNPDPNPDPNPNPNPDLDSNSKKPSKAVRFLRATGRSAGRVAKARAISDLKAAPGSIARLGANLATATTLGAIGVTSGIVSGDINTVAKNAMLGATTGVAVSSGVANRISSTIKNNYDSSAKEKWQRDFYGAEYSQKMKEKADKEFMKDKQIRELYRQQLKLKNKAEIDRAMQQATEYRKYGINDNDIIIKAMKLEHGNEFNRADKRRIAAAKLAENSRTQKDFETNMKRFASTQGIQQTQVDDMTNLVKQINNL